ncbi:hypothetical protein HanIR_Chr03g0130791 [Helianthus annuus]|nr:hypothetical protein HanIR_Chr03g0130791 [Helianthus annuus]
MPLLSHNFCTISSCSHYCHHYPAPLTCAPHPCYFHSTTVHHPPQPPPPRHPHHLPSSYYVCNCHS